MILFSVLVLCTFFALFEGVLRATGFERSTDLESIRFAFPLEDFNAHAPEPFLARDPRLFWKPKPNVLGHNSRGILGPEFSDSKPAGVYRVVCLGDSCTHFGPQPYPERLQKRLDSLSPNRYEVINAGVVGYTSHQGLVRLETEIIAWNPDLVTIYFGWNDHWLAHGLTDRRLGGRPPSRFSVPSMLGRLRFYQFLEYVLSGVAARKNEFRVSLPEYAENLSRIKQVCDRHGVRVLFLTAPHALDLGIPEYLAASAEVKEPDRLVEVHRSYNREVRRTATELRVPLVDLERRFERMDRKLLFLPDHIHLSDSGRSLVAEILLEAIVDPRLVPTE